MKTIKKGICLWLALVLCFALTACTSEEDKAFEEANALLEVGDYEGAIAAFQAIGRYQEISSKIDQAQKLMDEANGKFLYGTWKDILTGTEFVLEAGGTGTLTTAYKYGDNTSLNITYAYSEDMVKLTSPEILFFEVLEEEGVTHLMEQNGLYDLVPAADYENLAPITVEITMDNWQDYFELREADYVYDNDFAEPEYRQVGYAVFLKEEYVSRLVNEYDSIEVNFELQYDEEVFEVNGDLLGGDFTLEKDTPWWLTGPFEQGVTATTTILDTRGDTYTSKYSDLYNSVAGFFHNAAGGWTEEAGVTYIYVPVNVQIVRAQGTMTLKR